MKLSESDTAMTGSPLIDMETSSVSFGKASGGGGVMWNGRKRHEQRSARRAGVASLNGGPIQRSRNVQWCGVVPGR
jgi:hypothetical protein